MKKILTLCLVAAMLLSLLAGCGGNKTPDTPSAPTQDQTPSDTPDTPSNEPSAPLRRPRLYCRQCL